VKTWWVTVLTVIGLAWCAQTTSAASTAPCSSEYAYAGAESARPAAGIAATLALVSAPKVKAGHVAAWVGVGGPGMGPHGADEWLQAGIAEVAGEAPVLYYEVTRPGDSGAHFVTLGPVAVGERHRIAVVEQDAARESWRVSIDGVRIAGSFVLPGSDGAFAPIATAENWDGGVAGTCNGYDFSFAKLALKSRAGVWQPFDLTRILRDPAYELTLRIGGFSAASR
jgi:hypothetical protein